VAAGQGLRAGGEIPKQFRRIAGETLLERALSAFAEAPDVTFVQPVIRPDDVDLVRRLTSGMNVLEPVAGGATRQASVRAGLEALVACTPDIVLVHDAARPFASASLITRAIAAAEKTGAAIPALPVTDTVKRIDSTGTIEATLDRNSIRLVQTPQAFAFPALFDAHRRALAQGRNDFTDDAALAEWAGIKVSVFAGEPGNIKFTTPEDFARAEAIQSAGLGDVRTGSGLDVHAFGPGDHVTLGGIRIPHVQALTGHSDADVALHALTDAILGALADGDIGAHFPPSDPQWRGASSDRFLTFAVERVRARGGRIAHLDLTIVCEAPRIGEHRDRMRANIANLAGIGIERVGVKATTSEKLGFTGRGEGIAAYATATIRLPWD
jgi:2-C-methyl-D-erythritol 4-phosphate cytidylyltransferase/2-C-methyl-D-erythritol 2,4-cyclodiphosphate synthase